MSGKRYTDEFNIEAVKHAIEPRSFGGRCDAEVGHHDHNLYARKMKFENPDVVQQAALNQNAEIRRLEAELKRVTEERDILKKAVWNQPVNATH